MAVKITSPTNQFLQGLDTELGGFTWRELLLQLENTWQGRFEKEEFNSINEDFLLAQATYKGKLMIPKDLTFTPEGRALYKTNLNRLSWILKNKSLSLESLARLNTWFWCRWIYKRSEKAMKTPLDLLGYSKGFERDARTENLPLEINLKEFKEYLFKLRDRDLKRLFAARNIGLKDLLEALKS